MSPKSPEWTGLQGSIKHKGEGTMASTYVRRFNLKAPLSDKQVSDFWKHLLGEFVPQSRR